MDIGRLIDLADQVLSSEDASDASLDRINEYCEAFGCWFDVNQPALESQQFEGDAGRLPELLEKHEMIVERVRSLKESAFDGLKAFRRRSKRIRAYAEVVPRRISISRKQKG